MSYLFRGRAKNPRQDKKQRAVTNVLPETTWNNEPLPHGIPPENKVVVTISRQFGSGGAEVGHIVARGERAALCRSGNYWRSSKAIGHK